jgi:CheY-like chemotaxis protein
MARGKSVVEAHKPLKLWPLDLDSKLVEKSVQELERLRGATRTSNHAQSLALQQALSDALWDRGALRPGGPSHETSHGSVATPELTAVVSGRVLVIDDEPDVAHTMTQTLADAGFSTCAVTQPALAIEAARQFGPEAIFCDLAMPVADGMELLSGFLSSMPHIPFVFVTAHANKEHLTAALNQGAFGIVEKPFHAEQLITVAAAACRSTQLWDLSEKALVRMACLLATQETPDLLALAEIRALWTQHRQLRRPKKLGP